MILNQVVSTRIAPADLGIAAACLGARNATPSGIVRAGLALFHGRSREEALQLAVTDNPAFSNDSDKLRQITAKVPEDLAQTDINRALAIRIGLGIAMGMSRPQAERWAAVKLGRPAKSHDEVTSEAANT